MNRKTNNPEARKLRLFVFALICFIHIGTDARIAYSAPLEPTDMKKSKYPLEGSVQEEHSLKNSLKIIPGRSESNRPGANTPWDGKVIQYSGSASNNPGNLKLQLRHGINNPGLNPEPEIWFGGQARSGMNRGLNVPGGKGAWRRIPSISTYTLTPSTGVMTFSPEYSSKSVSRRITEYSSQSDPAQDSRLTGNLNNNMVESEYKGVKTHAPGLGIIPVASSSQESKNRNGIFDIWNSRYLLNPRRYSAERTIGHGIKVYTQDRLLIASVQPGAAGTRFDNLPNGGENIWTSKTNSETSNNYHPGKTPIYSARANKHKSDNGITIWSPGYEVQIASAELSKETLSGQWRANQASEELSSVPGTLKMPLNKVEAVVGEGIAQKATPGILPEFQSNPTFRTGSPAQRLGMNWDTWYREIASAIYTRWQYAEVGAGTAQVRVIVEKDRSLSCFVLDFEPAPFVSRDIAAETRFKESALSCVKRVQTHEIPDFPALSGEERVKFDVVLKRRVDGVEGVEITGK